ncbi:hypothetical protein [Nocardia sp. IFM 10818]
MSDTEIQHIAAELARGNSPTVWFTPDAVGVTPGRSGKVVRLADPAEPDRVGVRPTGSDDTLAFSPTELTLTNPARRAAHRRPRVSPHHPERRDQTRSGHEDGRELS